MDRNERSCQKKIICTLSSLNIDLKNAVLRYSVVFKASRSQSIVPFGRFDHDAWKWVDTAAIT